MCKNDETEVVRAGEKLKKSKKKSKMPSAQNNSGRDWGRVSQWDTQGLRFPLASGELKLYMTWHAGRV